MNVEKIIKDFIEGNENDDYLNKYSVKNSLEIKDNKLKKYVYNEFSLQHELGNYFRELNKKTNKDYIIKYEFNAHDLNSNIASCKTEIDILIIENQGTKNEKMYAIELKYLKKDSAVPKRMFHCVEDMKFMYDVVKNIEKVKETYCVVITDNNHNFYEGKCESGNVELITRDKNSYKEYNKKLKEEINNKKKKLSINKRSKIIEQIEMSNELIKNPEEFPNIYEFFRKPKETWKKGRYIYSNTQDSLSIIDVRSFSTKVNLDWKPICKDNKDQYYVLKFRKD